MSSHSLLRIAIIGGNGHIGRGVVARALAEGHEVVSLDLAHASGIPSQDRYSYKQVDASSFNNLKKAVEGCNALVSLSAAYNQHVDGVVTDADTMPQHYIHNLNVTITYNALDVAAELGIDRVVLASSINAAGMLFSQHPQFDYFPIDENHPCRPEDAYSLSKYFCELQADAFCRVRPTLRVATLRFHWVVPDNLLNAEGLLSHKESWKDLWGWVSLRASSEAVLLALTASEATFPLGHQSFFIVAGTTCRPEATISLIAERYPEGVDVRQTFQGNQGLFDCSKAAKMLGWKQEGFPSGEAVV